MTLFIVIAAAVLLSAAVYVLMNVFDAPIKINLLTWIIITGVTVFALAPGAVALGTSVAKADATRFNEYWNGYETAAVVSVKECTRDGSCKHDYQCDPYTEVSVRTVSDGNGGTQTVTTTETKYHQCPYVTQEYTFKVETTLEDYTVASGIFAENPTPWRASKGIPSKVARGEPAAWVAVRARLAAKDPGPVTAVRSYDNFILASQSSILKSYSSEIETFKAKGWLPPPSSGAPGLYANKAYPVNMTLDPTWSNSVMRFNAAFGVDLQGDLHLVVAKGVDDPDAYTGALRAYWQAPKLGRNALSKNTLVVVLGTSDSKNVSWARAFTGMPLGNEQLLTEIQSRLKGAPLDPEVILGSPRGVLSADEVSVSNTNGLLEQAAWGTHQFERICMNCGDEGDNGLSFSYLSDEIKPSGSAQFGIAAAAIFLIALAWVIPIAVFHYRD